MDKYAAIDREKYENNIWDIYSYINNVWLYIITERISKIRESRIEYIYVYIFLLQKIWKCKMQMIMIIKCKGESARSAWGTVVTTGVLEVSYE